MIEVAADLNVFFNSNDFAMTATYTPNGGSVSTITVLFDKPFQADSTDSGTVDIEDIKPTVICKSTDVSSVAHGDQLIINSTTFHVVGIETNDESGGQSMTILYLEDQT